MKRNKSKSRIKIKSSTTKISKTNNKLIMIKIKKGILKKIKVYSQTNFKIKKKKKIRIHKKTSKEQKEKEEEEETTNILIITSKRASKSLISNKMFPQIEIFRIKKLLLLKRNNKKKKLKKKNNYQQKTIKNNKVK